MKQCTRRCSAWIATCVAIGLASGATANIDLELRPMSQTVSVDDTVNIGLYAVSDDPENSQLLSAIDLLFAWDPAFLQLLGLDPTGAAPALASFFPTSGDHGLNETVPPQDGDGFYLYFAPLGNPIAATPEGTLVTTFQFLATGETPLTVVDIVTTGGSPPGDTRVVSGKIKGLIITGTLQDADVVINGPPCPSDCAPLGGDGFVDVADLLVVLAEWGSPGPHDCDVAPPGGDGQVDVEDLLLVLAEWGGNCP